MTIYVLSGFNNYYNRIVKKFDTIEEYEPYVLHIQQNFNFVPNDNVNTQVVLGNLGNQYTGEGDYLLAVNELNEIVSRWFVIESVRDRAGQYTLTLHRDLVADHYNELLDAPMFIEKATLSDEDPMIWNNEGVSVNQIKTNEYTLRDDSGCAWIVGYFNRDYEGFENHEIKITQPPAYDTMTEEEFTEFKKNNGYTLATNYKFGFNHRYYGPFINQKSYILDGNTLKWKESGTLISSLSTTSSTLLSHGNIYTETLSQFSTSVNEQIINIAKMSIPFLLVPNETKFNSILAYNGKSIKVGSDETGYKYYKVSATRKTGTTVSYTIKNDLSIIDNIPAIPTYLKEKISQNTAQTFNGSITGKVFEYSDYISLSVQEVQSATISFSMKGAESRTHLEDAPYDMFCIPFSEDGLNMILGADLFGTEKPLEPLVGRSLGKISIMSFVQSIAQKMSSNLHDLQLLPYCPLSDYTIISSTFISRNMVKKDIDFVKEGNYIIPLIYCSTSQGTINSQQLHLINTETNEELSLPIQLGNKKIANECDMYRLCSPNYNGQFEFNPSRMNGIVGFNVDYTYLPYSPYIHINPIFNGLYGKDFDDARGLICQGDFSISYTSSKWEEYQVQNKNYANIFNRQIENMELTQDIQRKQQVFNAVTGTIMGGAGGALAGSKAGPYGAIAGAVVGTVSSAVGGALDVNYGDILRSEALDYTKDMYNYQLDNIKALPNSIAKVTAYTKNNKIFPILEYYTCTVTEKNAIANKIAYNGMTTMRIGTMNEFIGNTWSYNDIESQGYIKGKLIRLETVEDDYHIINAISGELDKGVFIK